MEESKYSPDNNLLMLAKSLSKLSTSSLVDPMITIKERLVRNRHLIDKLNKLRELLSIADSSASEEVPEM